MPDKVIETDIPNLISAIEKGYKIEIFKGTTGIPNLVVVKNDGERIENCCSISAFNSEMIERIIEQTLLF